MSIAPERRHLFGIQGQLLLPSLQGTISRLSCLLPNIVIIIRLVVDISG